MGLKRINKQTIIQWCLVILGCIILGFSTAIFLTRNNIISGGLSGVGIIIQYIVDPEQNTMIIDIVVWIISIGLWILSLFTLGKHFAFKTLIATILYPISLTIFLRVPVFVEIAKAIAGEGTTGDLLICALFGGLVAGIGISITFIGKGSTGGVDVISFLLNKLFGLPVALVTLCTDVTIILIGMFLLDFPNMIVNSLCGIICAAMMAIMIQSIYSKRENAVLVDIISVKFETLKEYILVSLNRGVTTYDVTGGYTGEKRIMLRTVVSNEEYNDLREFLAQIDPNAFVTFTPTHAVYGEGFKENLGYNRKPLGFLKKKEKNDKNNAKQA